MISAVIGLILIVATSGFYWYLLPRNGEVHPLVRNSDVGSMVTITIMTVLTVGTCLMFEGLFG